MHYSDTDIQLHHTGLFKQNWQSQTNKTYEVRQNWLFPACPLLASLLAEADIASAKLIWQLRWTVATVRFQVGIAMSGRLFIW